MKLVHRGLQNLMTTEATTLGARPQYLSRLFFAAAAALLLLAGCGAEQPASFRLGINNWPGFDFLYLAQEKGYYRDEGLDVHIVEFSSMADARRAFERGQIDALGATVIDVLLARDHSPRAPQIVQAIDYSNGADVILTRPGIRDGAALRGARIGVEIASLGIYVLARALEKHGLSLADVQPVAMDQLSMESAFRAGALDALVTYPPTSVKLLREGKVGTVFSTREIPGEVIDVIAVEAAENTRRAADVAALIRAYHRAIAYAQQNPADAYAIMAEREGLTPAEFRDALNNGIAMVSVAEQWGYFQPDGNLAAVIDRSDRILRHVGKITGEDRRAGASTAAFAGKKPSP